MGTECASEGGRIRAVGQDQILGNHTTETNPIDRNDQGAELGSMVGEELERLVGGCGGD